MSTTATTTAADRVIATLRANEAERHPRHGKQVAARVRPNQPRRDLNAVHGDLPGLAADARQALTRLRAEEDDAS